MVWHIRHSADRLIGKRWPHFSRSPSHYHDRICGSGNLNEWSIAPLLLRKFSSFYLSPIISCHMQNTPPATQSLDPPSLHLDCDRTLQEWSYHNNWLCNATWNANMVLRRTSNRISLKGQSLQICRSEIDICSCWLSLITDSILDAHRKNGIWQLFRPFERGCHANVSVGES